MAEGTPQAAAQAPEGFVAPGVRLAPVPDWVDFSPLETPREADPRFVVAGVCVLLEDGQVNLGGPEPAHFWRRAEMIVATSGASHAARFQVEFDPAFERLDIHFIRIHRADQVLTRGEAGDFEVLRRERNLEMRHFDGRLTVHLEIPDVRVGDIVETAWSVYGECTLLAGRYAGWTRFEWSPAGMVETRHRLLAPAARAIATKVLGGAAPEPTVTQIGDLIDRRWLVREREGVMTEPLALPWLHQLASLQLSEWRDWGEVAARYAPVYEETDALPGELEAKIGEFTLLARAEERAAALLRFVQQSVRYLAISMGEGGLVPRPIAQIWETRYGDCKDVTKLYVQIARRVGLDACPALVNTSIGEGLDTLLPTAAAFDHCLIRVRIDGKTYWLDATMGSQPSPLETLAQPRMGWALPLADASATLEHMGAEPFVTLCEALETIDLPDRPDKKVTYAWKTTSRGWRAEWLRAQIAQDGEVGYFKTREQNLQGAWPGAKLVERTLTDNVAENAVTVVQRYEIADAWKELPEEQRSFTTADTIVAGMLAPLDPGAIKLPIYMGRIGRIARRVEVTTAKAWGGTDWSKVVAHDAASLNFSFRQVNPKQYVLEEEFKIRNVSMPPESAERYRELAAELRATDVTFAGRVRKGKFLDAQKGARGDWRWLMWVWIAVIVVSVLARIFLAD